VLEYSSPSSARTVLDEGKAKPQRALAAPQWPDVALETVRVRGG
jgi:hypothetical protein